MIIDRRDNGVVVVTLNRPEKSNAIDTRMHHELMTFSKDFSDDPDLRVLVLTGAGKAFCSGGDFSADTAIEMPSLMEARRIIDNILECEKPLIAAVQGYALDWARMYHCFSMSWLLGRRPNSAIRMSKWALARAMAVSSSGRFSLASTEQILSDDRRHYWWQTSSEMGLAGFFAEKPKMFCPKHWKSPTSWRRAAACHRSVKVRDQRLSATGCCRRHADQPAS